MAISTADSILYAVLLILIASIDFFVFYLISVLNSENYRNGDGEFVGVSLKKYVRILLVGICFPLILITLNLMNAVALQLADITQFAGLIGSFFSIMLDFTIPWVVFIAIWILVTIWKDGNLIKEIQARMDEVVE